MYGFRKREDHDDFEITDGDDAIGVVIDEDSAETLVGYLNGGEGGFTVAPHMEDGTDGPVTDPERQWAFVNRDDVWVAYTRSEIWAEGMLSHLNRND